MKATISTVAESFKNHVLLNSTNFSVLHLKLKDMFYPVFCINYILVHLICLEAFEKI